MSSDTVEIFEVTDIRAARTRKPEWDLENHRDRQVICLSPMITQSTWTDLKKDLGYKENFKLRGTMKCALNKGIARDGIVLGGVHNGNENIRPW
jgi:hypothetical protein